jgi:hypothetical protein
LTKWTTKAGMSRGISNMHCCAALSIPKDRGRGDAGPAVGTGHLQGVPLRRLAGMSRGSTGRKANENEAAADDSVQF